MLAAMIVERVVWAVAAMVILGGAIGVISSENPVHSALSLVATLFGVALMFVLQEAYFLAAIQVIVYAGAIVVLFVFVIMLLGVDRFEILWGRERTLWRRPLALLSAVALAVLACVGMLATTTEVTGRVAETAPLDPDSDIMVIGRSLFTDYVWAFEITGVLLTVAVVGAVVLSRRPTIAPIDLEEFPDEDEPDGELSDGEQSDETEAAAS